VFADAPDDGPQPPWLRQHDLAVRHLVDGADELAAEVQHVHGLLNGAATIAATRDADAQEQLNSVAVVAAVGSGVPGLIFALYGADVLVPFTEGSRQLAVLGLIFLVTILVLMFVVSRMHQARTQYGRTVGTATVIAAALAATLLTVASLDPGRDPTVVDCRPTSSGTFHCVEP
jgi:hypothetical protein